MSEQDITLRMIDGRFNYRVGGIIIHSGKVLMIKNNGSSFYYTVGGRVKFGESSREAVLREAFEETQIHFVIDRLSYIHENFFVMESDNEPFHEITLFFQMKPNIQPTDLKIKSFSEEYSEVTLHWLPIDNLKDFHIYPDFFKTELNDLPNEPKHFITKNGTTHRIS